MGLAPRNLMYWAIMSLLAMDRMCFLNEAASSLVEQVGLLEGLERIGVEDGGPDVAVVAGRVSAAGEDVAEVGALVTRFDLRDQSHLGLRGFLERRSVHFRRVGEHVPIHIQERGGQVFDRHEALVEVPGVLELVDQFLRDGLAGFIVERVASLIQPGLRAQFSMIWEGSSTKSRGTRRDPL